MPRGVYDRKNKKTGSSGVQASSSGHTGGASKAKKSWKKTARIAASGGGIGTNDRFMQFTELTKYLQSLTAIQAQSKTVNPDLDQEVKATISTLRNFREIIFNVDTDQVLSGGDQNRQQANLAAAAPVPFNPPAYSGQVQQ